VLWDYFSLIDLHRNQIEGAGTSAISLWFLLFCSDRGNVKNIEEHTLHTVPKTILTKNIIFWVLISHVGNNIFWGLISIIEYLMSWFLSFKIIGWIIQSFGMIDKGVYGRFLTLSKRTRNCQRKIFELRCILEFYFRKVPHSLVLSV
jgi:hypothetical protein